MTAMQILVINCGSSSIKYDWIAFSEDSCVSMHEGQRAWDGHEIDHALSSIMLELDAATDLEAGHLSAIGHRFVHGGHDNTIPLPLNEASLFKLEKLTDLAPLHNAPALSGIRACLALHPGIPQFAVFDTAFHHTMPPHAYRYAIPDSWYQKHHVRRYGFHGSSHAYVSRMAQQWLDLPAASNRIISLHLGNGASACAIRNGRSIDTSMGLTPCEGLVMGSRSGDMDPAILPWLSDRMPQSVDELYHDLQYASGLKGMTGEQDMRILCERMTAGDPVAVEALEIWSYRISKYVGAYWVALGGLDALVMTGGIGENSAMARELICQRLDCLGIQLDASANHAENDRPIRDISAKGSSVPVLVIKTREAMEIAREMITCISGQRSDRI